MSKMYNMRIIQFISVKYLSSTGIAQFFQTLKKMCLNLIYLKIYLQTHLFGTCELVDNKILFEICQLFGQEFVT